MRFPFYAQHDVNDCGPACVKMITKYYHKDVSLEFLRDEAKITMNGVSLLGISEAAEKIGFRTLMVQVDLERLVKDTPTPCILHWNQGHFVVLYKIVKINSLGLLSRKNRYRFVIGDPAHGIVKVELDTFLKAWCSSSDKKGITLALYPTPSFYEDTDHSAGSGSGSLKFLFRYIRPYRKYLFQLFLGLILGSFISLIVPFLTQTLVDKGVGFQDLNLVALILLAQIFLFLGETAIDLIRSWVLLHVNTRISISILSDFLVKLMRLPIRFFDVRTTGDINQRIQDHERVENFLTGATLNTFFSMINVIVFSVIIYIYSTVIFLLFFILSAASVIWIILFLRRRKNLDYKRFQSLKDSQDVLYEMIGGMKEIKLYNGEISRRWSWERLQVKLFKLNTSSLLLTQYQQAGFGFINQLKNIFITYISARETIEGNLTLGMMLSISYMIGQTNGPLLQLTGFLRAAQDAKLSIERLKEIHDKENEEVPSKVMLSNIADGEELAGDIRLENVSFTYGSSSSKVLSNLSLVIPRSKVTAIVGASGSGKTTLLKLILKFYEPDHGRLNIGETNLSNVSPAAWRKNCGTVMQDGYIFADTIARNIAIDGRPIDKEKMIKAVEVANINEFIMSRPLNFSTKLGQNGSGISAGQKQRLLIARAVYKDPAYILFDEATSALDADNEKIIMENLEHFFSGKTVIIIAHRLSTVKHADQIVVLDKGKIIEMGSHSELISLQGKYLHLIKNQLELGE